MLENKLFGQVLYLQFIYIFNTIIQSRNHLTNKIYDLKLRKRFRKKEIFLLMTHSRKLTRCKNVLKK